MKFTGKMSSVILVGLLFLGSSNSRGPKAYVIFSRLNCSTLFWIWWLIIYPQLENKVIKDFIYVTRNYLKPLPLLGAGVRHSAHGKGHEEGGSTFAKAGSSLRSPPGNPQASTPITRACLLYYFALSPTPLTLRGAVPHHLFRRRS